MTVMVACVRVRDGRIVEKYPPRIVSSTSSPDFALDFSQQLKTVRDCTRPLHTVQILSRILPLHHPLAPPSRASLVHHPLAHPSVLPGVKNRAVMVDRAARTGGPVTVMLNYM